MSELPLRSCSANARLAESKSVLNFSLFFFSADETRGCAGYEFLLKAAEFADAHGFTAIWTPERHFHRFGGMYPEPAVLSAALAVRTKQLQIRAGSVVLPLHDTIRVAESWSIVDNLSNGRVGISLAPGYHPNDFVFYPDIYENRREEMWQKAHLLQRLWCGRPVGMVNGEGTMVDVTVFPRPVQRELPLWITAVSEDTFGRAGTAGLNVLTALVTQTIDQLSRRIALYRAGRESAGFDPRSGIVSLMIHAFVGTSAEEVRATVHGPFIEYLRANLDLLKPLAKGRSIDPESWGREHFDALLDFAFERYLSTSSLMGTIDGCEETCGKLESAGVDELCCLIDFGVDPELVLAKLANLDELRVRRAPPAPRVVSTMLSPWCVAR